MKKLILSVLALSTIGIFAANASWSKSAKHLTRATVNVEESVINWTGSKEAYAHSGTLKFKSGHLVNDHGTIVGGELVIDMSSMVCTDIEDEKKAASLVGHLSTADFFNVEKFPTANITIAEVTKGSDVEGMTHTMTGKFSMLGVAKEIEIPAAVKINGHSFHIKSTFKLDRTKWGMNYGSGTANEDLPADKVIMDDFDISVDVVFGE